MSVLSPGDELATFALTGIGSYLSITSATLVSIGEENGNLLQYSCLKNSMNRGAWQATVRGVAKESDTT